MSNIPQLDEALESITAIREANAAARKAEDAAIAAKEVYQTRKKTRDAAIAELQRVIEDHTKPLPLFAASADTRAKSTETALPGISGGPDDKSTGPTPTIDPGPNTDAWRYVQLSAVDGLAGKLADKLAEAGLATLGALADHTARGGRLFDLPGIGEKTAEKIEQALEDYWAEARKAAETVEPETFPVELTPAAWKAIKLAEILPAEIARGLEGVNLVDLGEIAGYLGEGAYLEDIPGRPCHGVPYLWTDGVILAIRRALLRARWDDRKLADAMPFEFLARPSRPDDTDSVNPLAELAEIERDLAEEYRQEKLAAEAEHAHAFDDAACDPYPGPADIGSMVGVVIEEAPIDGAEFEAAIAAHDEALAAGEPAASPPDDFEPVKVRAEDLAGLSEFALRDLSIDILTEYGMSEEGIERLKDALDIASIGDYQARLGVNDAGWSMLPTVDVIDARKAFEAFMAKREAARPEPAEKPKRKRSRKAKQAEAEPEAVA